MIKVVRTIAIESRYKNVQQTNIEPYELLNVIKKVSVIKNILNIQNFLKFYIQLFIWKKKARDSIELLSRIQIVILTNEPLNLWASLSSAIIKSLALLKRTRCYNVHVNKPNALFNRTRNKKRMRDIDFIRL